jgi:hypothetical protein
MSSAPLPIVFIHYGNSNYLPFTLGQAKLMSMRSPIVLIGDTTNKILPFVTHVDMNSYAKQAVEFQKIYRHLSPNGFPYELFCFIRWFLLRDFMLAHGLKEIIHVDSDVLLYVDVNQEQSNWKDYQLSLVNGVCAGNMFVNGTKGLENLCQIIWDMYAGPGAQQKLEQIYEERRKFNGAVSDMVALRAMYDNNRDRVAEMTGIQPDGTYWDANIHMDEGFDMLGPIKRVRFVDGIPYCRQTQSGNEVRFKGLHFQGIAKQYIEPAFRQSRAGLAAAAEFQEF